MSDWGSWERRSGGNAGDIRGLGCGWGEEWEWLKLRVVCE